MAIDQEANEVSVSMSFPQNLLHNFYISVHLLKK